MAHVWNVIDGDIYVSKNGDDVTGDGSMAAPYASINKGFIELLPGQKLVLGAGVWKESAGVNAAKNFHLIGDGDVIFDGSDSVYFSAIMPWNNAWDWFFTNLQFVGYDNHVGLSHDSTAGFVGVFQMVNCYFEGADAYKPLRQVDLKVSAFKCIFNKTTKQPSGMVNCTVIAKNTYYLTTGLNCIIVGGRIDLLYSPNYSVLYNCLFYYNNTLIGTFEQARLHTYGYKLDNCNNLNPKFNNPDIGDYTLQSDSPCLFAGKNNTTIGAFGLGYSFDANSSEFTKEGGAVFSQTTLVDDIIRTSQVINGVTRFLFQLASGHASGNVEGAWIDLQTIRYLLITRLFANIIYNASGVATSRPDNLETAGEKAVFYDFELKYCNEESEKATAAWKNVIWNKAVTIDNTGRGNADPAFVASEAQYISARFIKIKLYMTEA